MSAIAFYDSGRLLPYRHDLKQKQIQQRNIDAENTRKYIGYAGGAFANMAERTGTIFGARLGSTDAEDQKYGGGTVGAEYAKADWQKGTMDDENKRREVTHRLGLLTENVKYGNFQREYEAWGGRDKKVLREAYNDKWDQYLEDSKTMDKLDLIKNYGTMFSKKTRKLYASYLIEEDEGLKEKLFQELKGKPLHTPLQSFEKYATENELYNPSVAAKPREDVKLLMAYLKEGVKFPGMNNLIDKLDEDGVETEIAGAETKPENTVESLYEKIKKEHRASKKPKKELKLKDDGDDWFDFDWLGSGDDDKEAEAGGRVFDAGDPLLYEGLGTASKIVDGKEVMSTYKPAPHVMTSTAKQYRDRIRKLALQGDLTEIPLVTQTTDGEWMTPFQSLKQLGFDTTAVIAESFSENIPLFGGLDPTASGENAKIERLGSRWNQIKNATEKSANQVIAKARADGTGPDEVEALKTKVTAFIHDTLAKGEVAVNSFKEKHIAPIYEGGSIDSAAALAAGDVIDMKPVSGGYVDKENNYWESHEAFIKANPAMSGLDLNNYLTPVPTTTRPAITTDTAEPVIVNQEDAVANTPEEKRSLLNKWKANLKKMQDSRSQHSDAFGFVGWDQTLEKELQAKIRLAEQQGWGGIKQVITRTNQDLNLPIGNPEALEENAITNILANEDANMTGFPIQDNKHTILAGSVDAWGIANRNSVTIDDVINNHLKLKGARAEAFRKYFNAVNVNDYLGHTKKVGDLTSVQEGRRKQLHLSPDETRALVEWAYKRNLRTLTIGHGFLDDKVYERYPALKQLLGDLSYRHGGSFMKGIGKNRYSKLAVGIRAALWGETPQEKMLGIDSMYKELFKQGRYSDQKTEDEKKLWPGELTGPRYRFLKDRFEKFTTTFSKYNPAFLNYTMVKGTGDFSLRDRQKVRTKTKL